MKPKGVLLRTSEHKHRARKQICTFTSLLPHHNCQLLDSHLNHLEDRLLGGKGSKLFAAQETTGWKATQWLFLQFPRAVTKVHSLRE